MIDESVTAAARLSPPTPLETILSHTGIALVCGGTEVTYPDLADRTWRRAGELVARGVRPGDRVGYCGLNRVEVFELYLACAEIGACLLPLNHRLTAAELDAQVGFAEPSVIYVADGFQTKLGGRALADLDAEPAEADAGYPTPARGDRAGWLARDLLMMFTSGTTGRPKAAVLTGRSVHFTVLNGIATQGLSRDSRILSALPTFHVGGLNIQVLPGLMLGATVHLHPSFEPAATLADIEDYNITHTVLVPAMLDAVAARPDFGPQALAGLDIVHTGSSTIPDKSVRPWIQAGVPVAPVYGATETGPTAVVVPVEEALRHPTLAGQPGPHTELRVVDPESCREVDDGQVGEIWLRGPHLFDRYWNDPDTTSAVLVDGWYRTNDAGRIHSSGHLQVVDRLDGVIISGGENVAAVEVEAVLGEHPAVAEVAVVGRAHPRWGHAPVAYVVADGAPPTLADLWDWCRDRLADFKRPADLVIIDDMPRTALGKVQKHLLVDPVG